MSNQRPVPSALSIHAIRRMPCYLYLLRQLKKEGIDRVSAARVAAYFGLSEIQVRKDFAAVCTLPGKPKTGFETAVLIDSIEERLGFRNTKDAVLVGAGSLGTALLHYRGFEAYGLKIIAAFDYDTAKIGTLIDGCHVLPADKISSTCRRLCVHLGIVTVPAQQAQVVCDQLVAGGVRAIWNFAPVPLSTPDSVLVHQENMASSLAVLSHHLDEIYGKPGE